MRAVRWVVALLLVCVALILQVSVFSAFAWDGVVPDLVLLVVVAGALARGGQFGMILGFAGGVLLDLAPPADHTAGRWALALLVAGYVAGLARQPEPTSIGRPGRTAPLTAVGTVAACSFVSTSIYALTGLALGEGTRSIGEMLQVVAIGLVWDVLLAPFVLPGLGALFRRLERGFGPNADSARPMGRTGFVVLGRRGSATTLSSALPGGTRDDAVLDSVRTTTLDTETA